MNDVLGLIGEIEAYKNQQPYSSASDLIVKIFSCDGIYNDTEKYYEIANKISEIVVNKVEKPSTTILDQLLKILEQNTPSK